MAGLVIVSNRGPLRRSVRRGGTRWTRSAGGLVAALDPVLNDRVGVWVCASEHGEAPEPHALSYDISSVELSEKVESLYCGGFCNGVLWPVLHGFPATMRLGEGPWDEYVLANEAFAGNALSATREDGLLWVHDYHLMLVPGMLRGEGAEVPIGWFCHVPWPGVDTFKILPWARPILEGLLGADLVGFHTEGYAKNFLECTKEILGAAVDLEKRRIHWDGREVNVGVFPIGIDVASAREIAADPEVERQARSLKSSVYDRRVILGVDRLDYTKGIPERLLAYERVLRRNPGLRDECVLVQVMVPSRTEVGAYRQLKREVDRLVGDINGEFGRTGEVAVHYLFRSLDRPSLYAHYRAADVALVTPLRDGMNLVAQEYVASRVDGDGVLILSELAGAAEHLQEALLVNPYDIHRLADKIEEALEMDRAESRRRMKGLQAVVDDLDVHVWARRFISTLEGTATRAASSTSPR